MFVERWPLIDLEMNRAEAVLPALTDKPLSPKAKAKKARLVKCTCMVELAAESARRWWIGKGPFVTAVLLNRVKRWSGRGDFCRDPMCGGIAEDGGEW